VEYHILRERAIFYSEVMCDMKNEPVTADKITVESTMNYRDMPVLHYRIEYPRFHDSGYQPALDYINEWYRKLAVNLQKRYETELYREAADQYDYAAQNQFSFHMYEAVLPAV